MEKLPKGLWPVMITPFDQNNEVDLGGLERLTHLYLEAGANGLFANCLSSEMYQMTSAERLQVTSQVVKYCKNKVPIVATGSFSKNIKTNVEFVKKIYDTGVHAVILVTGMLVEPDENDDILKARLEVIMSETGNIPLGVYECPVPYKRLLSPSILKWMAGSGRFVYHKDTSCNTEAMKPKAEAVKGSSFNLYNADTTTSLNSLEMGFCGISPISANFYPELYTFMLKEFFANGRTNHLNKLLAFLTMMDRVTHSFYPLASKLFLQKRGLKIQTNTRIPTETLTNADHIRLHALMESFNALAEMYNIKKVL
jgi:4-hydroxy-tetrahydrodipicolinate synthase